MDFLDELTARNTDWDARFHDKRGQMKIAAAAIGGATSLIGGVTSAIGSSNASSAQAAAAQQAAALQAQQYADNKANQQPYIGAGQTALNTIGQDQANGTGFATPFSMQSFMSNPAYQFQLQQGQNAVNSSSAATGGVLNGGTLKALSQYSQGLANTTYGDAYNRYLSTANQQYNQLYGVANLGESAANSLGAQGVQSANNQGNYLTQVGNAQAAGDMGIANGINQAIGGAGTLGLAGYQSANSQSGYNGGQVFQGYQAGNSQPLGIQATPSSGLIPLQSAGGY